MSRLEQIDAEIATYERKAHELELERTELLEQAEVELDETARTLYMSRAATCLAQIEGAMARIERMRGERESAAVEARVEAANQAETQALSAYYDKLNEQYMAEIAAFRRFCKEQQQQLEEFLRQLQAERQPHAERLQKKGGLAFTEYYKLRHESFDVQMPQSIGEGSRKMRDLQRVVERVYGPFDY